VFLVQRCGQPRGFPADEEAYMRQYGLNEQQADAIRSRQVLQLIAAGGNAYYLAKFAGIFGWTCRTSAPSRPA
jgi:hypothetical protein